MALVEFIKPSYSAVKSINGQIGNVNLTAEDIGAATEEYVIKAIGEIPQPDMSDYATIGDVEDATRGLATEAYVNQKVAEAAVGGEVNLDDYLRKDELGVEIDVAVRERGLTNEDRAREIANEVCDERGTGSGGGEINYDEVWFQTEQRLEQDFRYTYVCGRLGTEQDDEWHEIYDGNLTEYVQRRRDSGDRFVLYMEGTPAKIDVEDGYWNEETQEDVPWKLHINWEDGDHIHYSWEIRDINGLYHYYCNGYGPVEYGLSEGRVNELIEEGLANAGGGSVAVDETTIKTNTDGQLGAALRFNTDVTEDRFGTKYYTRAWGGYYDPKAGATDANGECAFAFGRNVHAGNEYSACFGKENWTRRAGQFVVGIGAQEDYDSMFVVGNGSALQPKSIFKVSSEGNGTFAGDVFAGADALKLATEEYVNEAVANAGGGGGGNEWQWVEKDPTSWDNYVYTPDYSHIRIVCSFGGYDNRTTTFDISTGANRTFADENGYTYYETLTYNGAIYSVPIANNGDYLSVPSSVTAVGATGNSCSINMIGYYYWG